MLKCQFVCLNDDKVMSNHTHCNTLTALPPPKKCSQCRQLAARIGRSYMMHQTRAVIIKQLFQKSTYP